MPNTDNYYRLPVITLAESAIEPGQIRLIPNLSVAGIAARPANDLRETFSVKRFRGRSNVLILNLPLPERDKTRQRRYEIIGTEAMILHADTKDLDSDHVLVMGLKRRRVLALNRSPRGLFALINGSQQTHCGYGAQLLPLKHAPSMECHPDRSPQ